MNPLVRYLASERRAVGRHGGGVRLAAAFAEHGWPISSALVSMWVTGKRIPNALNQARLEIVTGGKVRPRHWMTYRLAGVDVEARSA